MLKCVLRLAVSVGLLTFLLLKIDINELGDVLKRTDFLWCLAALAAALTARSVLALRWVVLLRARGTRLPWWRALQINLIGNFFNSFFPSTIGGDIVRAHRLSALKGRTADSVASVVIERALGLLALAIIATFGCVFFYSLIHGTGAITAIVVVWSVVGAAALVFYTSNAWQRLIRRFVKPKENGRLKALTTKLNALHDSASGFRSSPGTLVLGLILSIVAKMVTATAVAAALAQAVGADVDVGYFIVFGSIRQCIMMMPISIQGIGLREASAVFFYTKAGMTEPQALAFGLLGYVLVLTVSAIGGIVNAASRTPSTRDV